MGNHEDTTLEVLERINKRSKRLAVEVVWHRASVSARLPNEGFELTSGLIECEHMRTTLQKQTG